MTTHDIRHWLICVPRIDPDSPRAQHYARAYNVPSKVARAKIDGSWETINPPRLMSLSFY